MVDAHTVRRWLRAIEGAKSFIHDRRLEMNNTDYSLCNKHSAALDLVHDELLAATTKPLEIEP